MPLDRPIPAFYSCYLLRSTVSHKSLYVGSTPNPVRRLRQHNGVSKGGAVRTSRDSMRPWEMAAIVTGFPSHIAALQFEWAWQNPHLTLHIPPSSRLTVTTEKKKSGRPKRPRHTITSLLSNLHLLLRVPSFSRWPLELRFFAPDVHKAWTRWSAQSLHEMRSSLSVIADFPPNVSSNIDQPDFPSMAEDADPSAENGKTNPGHGIHTLPITYASHKSYLEKSKSVIDFELEGSCAVCTEFLDHNDGIYTVCPQPSCGSVAHLSCLSSHFLKHERTNQGIHGEDDDLILSIVPIEGHCPGCDEKLKWVDIVKEVTLRMRGQKEVEKLLKKPREKAVKVNMPKIKKMRNPDNADSAAMAAALASSHVEYDIDSIDLEDSDDDNDDEDERPEFDVMEEDAMFGGRLKGGRHVIDDLSSDDNDSISVASVGSTMAFRSSQRIGYDSKGSKSAKALDTVIEDSDWDDAEVLD